MDEFTDRFQLSIALNLLFQEILNRFNVMVGSALDILDALSILF